MTKVSVLLTSYNHERFLRESIDSVLNQSFTDYELIIWDDGSTDSSRDIIQSYDDKRIIPVLHEVNQRGGIIRQAIANLCQGEYVAIIHSDDLWEPDKLEKQVEYLDQHSEVGAVFSRVTTIDDEGKDFSKQDHYAKNIFEQPNRSRYEWLNYFFYTGNAFCHPSVLARKTCYLDTGNYNSGFAQLPDFDMWVRMCLKYEIFILPEKLVKFRIHEGEQNTSGNRIDVRTRAQFEYLHVLENFKNISSVEELEKIFPTSKKYHNSDGGDQNFLLAMVSLDSDRKINQLFGLNLLFEIANDPSRMQKVKALYGFSRHKYFELSAAYDIFTIELTNGLDFESEIRLLKDELDDIKKGRIWRFLNKIKTKIKINR